MVVKTVLGSLLVGIGEFTTHSSPFNGTILVGIGEITTHFRTYFNGMFTGGTGF